MVFVPTPYTGGPSQSVVDSGDPSVNALLHGTAWGTIPLIPTAVSYSFPESLVPAVWSPFPPEAGYGPSVPDAAEPWDAAYRGLTGLEQQAFRDALATWEEVCNIDFVEVLDLPALVGDIRIAWTGAGQFDKANTAATGRYPGSTPASGDIWLNAANLSTDFTKGGYSFQALIHEIGHTIGLKHSFDGDVTLPADEDSKQYTVMSYTPHPGVDSSIWPQTPMIYDILAAQYIYGFNYATRAGDTVYEFAAQPAEVKAVWDGGGHDLFDLNNQQVGATVDLNAGGFSSIGLLADGTAAQNNIAIAYFVTIEDLVGTGFADEVTGNFAGNRIWGREGDDILYGGEGNDTIDGEADDDLIFGEGGRDSIAGGAGNDTISGGSEQDSLDGGLGSDTVDYTYVESDIIVDLAAGLSNGAYAETISSFENAWTGSGNDSVNGTSGRNIIETNGGADTVTAGNGDDVVHGGTDGDHLYGNMGEDSLYGEGGTDRLSGGEHNDTLSGGAGDDTVHGDSGNDSLLGDGGHDSIRGGDGRDTVNGGTGNDTIFGDDENDVLSGGGGEDSIEGNDGNDILEGNGGHDELFGDGGNDTLKGGAGDDTLIGGSGDDWFFFAASDFSNGVFERDIVEDYDIDIKNIVDSYDVVKLGFGSKIMSETVVGNDLEIAFDGDGDIVVFVGITDINDILFV